tara:strand:+ start:156320 stop:158704 length:2385 start_codon:yes stop_codon:yes gene_type:complete
VHNKANQCAAKNAAGRSKAAPLFAALCASRKFGDTMKINLTQGQRALALLIDVFALLAVSYISFGSVVPPLGQKGFWFYTALLGVLVGAKLITPFYVKPVDAIAYAVPAFIALMLSNDWTQWGSNAQISYVVAVTVTALIGGSAFFAVLLNGWGRAGLQEVSNRLRLLTQGMATPQIIYSPIMVFAMIAYHYDSPNEIVSVSVAMLLTITFSSGDILIRAIASARLSLFGKQPLNLLGTVAAYQKPGIYLLRCDAIDEEQLPAPIIIRDPLTGLRLAYALDTVGRENGHLLRAIELSPMNDAFISDSFPHIPLDSAMLLSESLINGSNQATKNIFDDAIAITGLVTIDSTIPRLFIEVTQNEGIAVGRLLSVEIHGRKVLYQLVAGSTREEAVFHKNTYGYLRAQAQQIGIWEDRKFTQCLWLPEMHAPVKLEAVADYEMTEHTIGRFPQTNYTAEIGDINQLVTHNTAILGILGVGKSMLAIELVERMLAQGIKVICLDLTNQYAKELDAYYCPELGDRSLANIQAACEKDSEAIDNDPEAGGSLPNLKQVIEEDMRDFISDKNPQLLKIYNPSDFVATHQEFEPKSYQENGKWHRAAGLYTVTPVQATQIISEAALNCVSDRMSDKARVCLVYEEAHALVPEWNSVVVEGDKRATSGTARAILQGRKYGLGCMLVTQRTANVTKTILNQCNTIFAMRTYDETGKEFLSNYLGRDYANELSSLPERHTVFFGRGSNCENPVMIALNNRDDFLTTFRNSNPPPDKEDLCRDEDHVADDEGTHGDDANFDDDIPF